MASDKLEEKHDILSNGFKLTIVQRYETFLISDPTPYHSHNDTYFCTFRGFYCCNNHSRRRRSFMTLKHGRGDGAMISCLRGANSKQIGALEEEQAT